MAPLPRRRHPPKVLLRRFRDLTNNLKLIRREVVQQFLLRESGFAVNAETGLQPLIMGCHVKEIPISWVGRGYDMGNSSFRVLRAGSGYLRVLWRIWLQSFFGMGVYRGLRAFTDKAREARQDESFLKPGR